ncbi:MAG TPA: AsmA family protein, partial [Syntrophales bacterium]|nr:AsmA family protein [Syntrophales bacterium]
MLKKAFWGLVALVCLLVVTIVAAGIILYKTVDKTFIESHLSATLHRQVTIEKIDVSLFSIVSGIEAERIAVSNFKTPETLAALAGHPVDEKDLFADLEAFRFKLKFLPLLKRQVEIQELLLIRPVVRLVKDKRGRLNIDDLIRSKKKPLDDRKPWKEDSAPPLSADNLPVAVAISEIGLKDARITYHDAKYNQTFQAYNLTALLQDIRIDPKALAQNDEMRVKLDLGVKTLAPLKTGSVQSFDLTLGADGKVIPFDLQTRLLNPEALVRLSLPSGKVTGLQVFNALTKIPILGDYLGSQLSFLKGTQRWSASTESGMNLRYKGDQVEIKSGRLDLAETKILFDGGLNLASKAIKMNLNLTLSQDLNDGIQTSLAKKFDAAIKRPDVRKYVDPSRLAMAAMEPLLNDDG